MAKYLVNIFLTFWSFKAHSCCEPGRRYPVFVTFGEDYGFRRMRAGAPQLRTLIFGCAFLLVSVGQLVAQTGNEWITPGQPYFKIPVAQQGIYRLSADALFNAGVPPGTDPDVLQLFHRGVEQAIVVSAGSDGSLDTGDYLEFYGQRNDGTQDANLYTPRSAQPHSYYNLYSDTTAYFLTLGSGPGKRASTFDQSPGAQPPVVSHTDEKLLVNTMQYYTGRDEHEVQLTVFDLGEGWTGYRMLQGQALDYTITSITQPHPASGTPTVELLIQGWGPMQHHGDIFLGSSQRLAGSISFTGFESYTVTVPAQWSDIDPDGSLAVRVRCNGVSGGADRFSVSYVKVRYPQTLNMENGQQKVFELGDAQPVSLVSISNAPSGTRLFDVTDPGNIVVIGAVESATLTAVIETASTTRIFATAEYHVPTIKSVNFRAIAPSQYDYIIISNPLLRTPALGYADPVDAYAAYRASDAGGGYRPLVVNTQELFDQFNYGEYSSLAIYNFMRYLSGSGAPKFLLLAGKGLEVYYGWNRVQATKPYGVYQDFIPSAGYPSSDMVFSAGLSGTTHEPAVPTGRIPALKSEDIAAYLNKVIEMESRTYDGLWRKNVMHLSGGIYDGEPQLFKSYMEEFQVTAQGAQLGGKVSALAKHSKEVQMINIADQVNDGLNLITFFGHASPTLLDFQLGFVTDPIQGYNNKGKYPTLLMNGCQVGSFNLVATLFGEDWIVAKDRGALGFIAHSGYGFTYNLRRYTQLFYDVGYGDPQFVSKGLGEIQKEVARRFMENEGPWLSSISQVQQMMLLGDPAVKLFGATKSDLEITDAGLSVSSFDGKPISMQSDSFAVRFIVKNYGLAPDATVRVEVLRTLSDNSTITYDSLFALTRYSDTLTMVIRKQPWEVNGFGDNHFRVTIDPDNVIDEYTKTNNVAGKTVAIVSNGTTNLFPVHYSIVNDRDISLSLSTYDLLSDEREFIVELDTTYDFSSAYAKQWTVKGRVLARQEVQLPEGDTIAYYWRTRLASPAATERTDWETSSFTYINNGHPGWAQVRFPQFFENSTEGLVKDTVLRQIRFQETVQPVSVRALSSQVPDFYSQTSMNIGGVEFFHAFPTFACRASTINFLAFDRKSAVPYLGVKLEWFNSGGRACGREPVTINSYYYTEMSTDGITDVIGYVNNIPTGDSVVLFNIGNAYYSLWPAAAKAKLGELGISEAQINALVDDEPVIIFGRKGDAPGTAVVYRSTEVDPALQSVSVSRTITGGYSTGTMQSDRIGPALSWDALHTRASAYDVSDEVSFSVSGIRMNGEEELLITDVTGARDLGDIDATVFPYLRLSFNTSDGTYLTSAQLNRWLVTFTPGPEGLLTYAGTRDTETVEEGMPWRTEFGFVNISDQQFPDSLTVNYEVFNQDKLITVKSALNVRAPLPGDTTQIPVTLNTNGLAGMNDFQLFVNPRVLPEQNYTNNLLLLTNKIEVVADGLNPVLDVTIDGRQVLNGDYVRPNPEILIRLWDENRYLLKTDTVGVRLFLTYPCGAPPCSPQRISLSDSRVKWFAATPTSDFRVEFHPVALVDGEYTLRVEGADARGNGGALAPYEVTFVVKNETTLTVSEAYPNPADDDVFFRIVVSGGAAPDRLELRIVGVNGQLQTVLTQDDFPALQVGSNELAWSVRTRNGNALPNGIYIYHITVGVSDTVVRRVGKLAVMK